MTIRIKDETPRGGESREYPMDDPQQGRGGPDFKMRVQRKQKTLKLKMFESKKKINLLWFYIARAE